MDIREISPGLPWRMVLDAALSDCTALLVVIGPGWTSATDANGKRRLEDERDTLRREVAEALRKGVRVFPLLVDGADMPSAEVLPDDVKDLAGLQGHDLTVKHWRQDVAKLIAILKVVSESGAMPAERKPSTEPRSRLSENDMAQKARREAEADARREQSEAEERRLSAEQEASEERQRTSAEAARRKATEEAWRKQEDAGRIAATETERRTREEHPRELEAQTRGGAGQKRRREPEQEAQHRQTSARVQGSTAHEARSDCDAVRYRSDESQAPHDSPAPSSRVVTKRLWVGALVVLVGLAGGTFTYKQAQRQAEIEAARNAPEQAAEGDKQRQAEAEKRRKADSALPWSLRPKLVKIPAGSFEMGERHSEEPVHRVTFARPFYLGVTEVTFAQYDVFCEATARTCPDDLAWGRGARPVINVDWADARSYANWLGTMTGTECRLPSEAEWEYAARAETTTRYPWGDEPGSGKANFRGSGSRWSGKQTAPVASFPPNRWGVYDTSGNVWEWVEDCWHEDYQGAPNDGRAWREKDSHPLCSGRPIRGGSWGDVAANARSAERTGTRVVNRDSYLGFRVLCSSPFE
jgi:formylglycine-generating enzyme required for sulfatase activity